MGRLRFWLSIVVGSFGAAAVGCVDNNPAPDPGSLPPTLASHSSALIADQQHGGPVGFFFLPPVVPTQPAVFSGGFEPRLAPSVRIDRIDPATGTTLSTVTTLTPLTAEKVRRNLARELYVVRWQTGRYPLSPRSSYRIRVLVGDRELGFADVRVVTRQSDLRGIDTSRFVGVRHGDILPIRFRIEQSAVDKDNDGVFDWMDNCATVPNATGSSPPPQPPPVMRLPPRCNPDRSACDPQELDCLLPVRPTQVDTDGDGTGDACECLNVTCAPADLCHGAARCEEKTGTCNQPPLLDQDGDRECDATDGCPSDAAKMAPGQCGCGVPDVDSDGDGTADCLDSCPVDPRKVTPGLCGCSVADLDSDADGVVDCLDGCPTDPAKLTAGVCGCGQNDGDTDSDGTPDCHDACPSDRGKVQSGVCGCGAEDAENDGDGVPDCVDACPRDVLKVAKGVCGCGVLDTDSDGDGAADCVDVCPADPAKVHAGPCGNPDGGVGAADAAICRCERCRRGCCRRGPCRRGSWGCVVRRRRRPRWWRPGRWKHGRRSVARGHHLDVDLKRVSTSSGRYDVLTDGYITRIPQSDVLSAVGGGLAHTHTDVPCPTLPPSVACSTPSAVHRR